MQYLKFTYIDAATGVPVTEAPAANGPVFPEIAGLGFSWARESQYPTHRPEFFGFCPDDSNTSAPGVLAVLSQEDCDAAYAEELTDRKRILIEKINAKRDTLEAQGFPHAGLWFQSDERSVARINSTALTAQFCISSGAQFACPDWLSADNTPLPVDAQGMLALQASLTAHAGLLHAHARSIKALVEAAETHAALSGVDINDGWPAA